MRDDAARGLRLGHHRKHSCSTRTTHDSRMDHCGPDITVGILDENAGCCLRHFSLLRRVSEVSPYSRIPLAMAWTAVATVSIALSLPKGLVRGYLAGLSVLCVVLSGSRSAIGCLIIAFGVGILRSRELLASATKRCGVGQSRRSASLLQRTCNTDTRTRVPTLRLSSIELRRGHWHRLPRWSHFVLREWARLRVKHGRTRRAGVF